MFKTDKYRPVPMLVPIYHAILNQNKTEKPSKVYSNWARKLNFSAELFVAESNRCRIICSLSHFCHLSRTNRSILLNAFGSNRNIFPKQTFPKRQRPASRHFLPDDEHRNSSAQNISSFWSSGGFFCPVWAGPSRFRPWPSLSWRFCLFFPADPSR